MDWPIPLASLSGHNRCYVGDRNLTERGPEPLLEPWIGHANLVSFAEGPFYPLPVVLASLAGYFGYMRSKGNYRFWVWVVPTVYLATKIILWTPASILGHYSWRTTLGHFFAGAPPHYPEEDVTVPFYTSLSYTLGALLDAMCSASSVRVRVLTVRATGCWRAKRTAVDRSRLHSLTSGAFVGASQSIAAGAAWRFAL